MAQKIDYHPMNSVVLPAAGNIPNSSDSLAKENLVEHATSFSGKVFSDGMVVPDCARIVVLIPSDEIDETRLGRKLWSIIPHFPMKEILLVGMLSKDEYQPRLQRRLVSLAAIISDNCFSINTMTIKSRNWITGLRGIVQPGDLIISHKGQEDHTGSSDASTLENALAENFKNPVYVISGFFQEEAEKPKKNFIIEALFWIALAAIIGGFFVFESDIYRESTGWVRNVFAILAVVIEVFLIWVWNLVKG